MSKRVYALYKVHDLIAVGDSPMMLAKWMVDMQLVDFAEEDALVYYDKGSDRVSTSFNERAEELEIKPFDILYELLTTGGLDDEGDYDFDYRIEEETVPYVPSLSLK